MIILKTLGIVTGILILVIISFSLYRALYELLLEHRLKKYVCKTLKRAIKESNQMLVNEVYDMLRTIQEHNIDEILHGDVDKKDS